jgi:hypothetical protein
LNRYLQARPATADAAGAAAADADQFGGTVQAQGGSGYEYGESGTTYLESPLIVAFIAARRQRPEWATLRLKVLAFVNT